MSEVIKPATMNSGLGVYSGVSGFRTLDGKIRILSAM